MKWFPLALLAAPACAGAAPDPWVLTVDGLGPVRIGMTIAEVEKAIGGKLEGDAIESDDICVEKDSKAGPPGIGYMFEDKKLVRISIGEGSTILTPRGIGYGASAADVRRAYGAKLESEPHAYAGPPAEYLTYWTIKGKRGWNFETDEKRRVQVIFAGTQAIQYIEGCA
ncbi:MAG: hypothetical protein ACREBK_04620 [Sphingomicrobium sp.]